MGLHIAASGTDSDKKAVDEVEPGVLSTDPVKTRRLALVHYGPMRDGIDWVKVGSGGRFEKIVSLLLSTLHPTSRRIDGAGGDGGRDHQFYIEDRLELWQSKYFIGRLSDGGRKKQITDSLITAAALQPDSWSLVTPMIPTPEELKWFGSLQKDYPFTLQWLAGDWLDARLADHPSIVRFFMSGNDEYVALLRELKQEQDALVDGLEGGRERLVALAKKIEDSNPFYSLTITIAGGQVTSTAFKPKYIGAEDDSPVTVAFNVITAPTPAGEELRAALINTLKWGDQVELPEDAVRDLVIEAPHGLGGRFPSGRITIGAAGKEPVDLRLRLSIWAPDGARLVSLPAFLQERVRGVGGVTLTGRDHSGVVNARLRVDSEAEKVSLDLSYAEPSGMLPGSLLPVLHFMRAAIAPNRLSFGLVDAPSTSAVPLSASAVPGIDEHIEFIESLQRVQEALAEPFEVPAAWTGADLVEARRAVRLLAGERVRIGRGPVQFTMDAAAAASFSEALGGQVHSIALSASEPYMANICGHDLELGPWTFYVQRATVDAADVDEEGAVAFSVLPQEGSGVEAALGELTHEAGLPPVPLL